MNYNRNGANAAASAENLVLNPASFHKLHEQQIRTMWELKLLDAPAYILFIVQIHSAAGWKWAFKPKEFCKLWHISKAAFYKAISKLKLQGLLNWETKETLVVWHSTNIAKNSPCEETILSSENSLSPETVSLHRETASLWRETLVSIERLETPEPLAGSESRNTPDSSQIFLKSTDNCSVAGEKELNEEEEVDKAAGEVAEPPKEEEVDSTAGAVTEPPIIAVHSTSLPAPEEAPPIEPTIPDVDNSSVKSLDIDEALENEEIEDEVQPTVEEVREVLQHLRAVGITLNHTIRAVVKKYYPFVNDALAHLKERIAQGERFGNLNGAFVKACKEQSLPEKFNNTGIPEEVSPISPEQMQLLDKAKAEGKILDHFFSSDGIYKVVMPGGFVMKPWWEFLGT